MSGAQLPGPLQAGDRVGLISTSGAPTSENVERAVALLQSWGLVPVLGEHILGTHPRAKYLAGTDQQRAADLQSAWCDDSLAGVFVVRGGYGTVRLLDHLDVAALRSARAKPLYGSSDVTGVHEFWADELAMPTWFTPMLATGSLLDDPGAIESLRRAVFEPSAGRTFTAATAETMVPGTAQGVTVGGNLSLLVMTMGAHGRTKSSNAGRIGLLEDVTEDIYKLDGMLQTLLRSGWFEGMGGLALGSWKDCGESADVRALCEELLVPLGIPLVWELGFGHDASAHSIPLGVSATLFADHSPRLVLQ